MKKTPQPTFFWQGTLILLPVLLLASAGLWSLRHDRKIAENEATQKAADLGAKVSEAFQKVLQSSDEFTPAFFSLAAKNPVAPGNSTPTPSEVLQWTRLQQTNGCLYVVAGSDHRLVFPGLIELPLRPRPLNEEQLSQEQTRLWAKLRAWRENNEENPETVTESFLKLKPGKGFEVQAELIRATHENVSGNSRKSYQNFKSLFVSGESEFSESGLPLRQVIGLRLLGMLQKTPAIFSREEVVEITEAISQEAVLRPTILSSKLIEEAAAVSFGIGVGEKHHSEWRDVWQWQEKARALFDASPVSDKSSHGWIKSDYFFQRFPLTNGFDLLRLYPRAVIADKAAKIVQAMKSFNEREMEVWIQLAGKDLHASAPIETLSVNFNSTGIDASKGKSITDGPPVTVAVFLINSKSYYSRQLERSLIFGGLIIASAVAAIAGLFAARRAFLRQSELSEMKSNFVSSVSHELRAPIASVRLLAESLERGTVQDTPKREEYYRFIVHECRRLSSLIENVLDFSRIDRNRKRYEFEPTDVVRLIQETMRLMGPYAGERQVGLELNQTLDLLPGWQVEADGRALQQALVNLIDNAIKHSPAGGKVQVGIEMKNEAKSTQLGIWIEDQGPGIPESEHERIFEKFYRLGSELRRETPGIGIGLTIVKHVAEAHAGRVELRSAPGQGSRFIIWLPVKILDPSGPVDVVQRVVGAIVDRDPGAPESIAEKPDTFRSIS